MLEPKIMLEPNIQLNYCTNVNNVTQSKCKTAIKSLSGVIPIHVPELGMCHCFKLYMYLFFHFGH